MGLVLERVNSREIWFSLFRFIKQPWGMFLLWGGGLVQSFQIQVSMS